MTDRLTGAEKTYTAVADQLVDRISALVPTHPEILKLEDPWGLFKVDGFKCDDLQPSLAQASWALGKVQEANKAQPA